MNELIKEYLNLKNQSMNGIRLPLEYKIAENKIIRRYINNTHDVILEWSNDFDLRYKIIPRINYLKSLLADKMPIFSKVENKSSQIGQEVSV